jgi:hypothetical protein
MGDRLRMHFNLQRARPDALLTISSIMGKGR